MKIVNTLPLLILLAGGALQAQTPETPSRAPMIVREPHEVMGEDPYSPQSDVIIFDNGDVSAYARAIAPLRGTFYNGRGSFLGIMGDDVSDETVESLRLPGEYGALVKEVIPGTAAEKGALQPNDVIIGFNGQRVESMMQLRRYLAETPVGREVILTIVRNGSEVKTTIELGEQKGFDNRTWIHAPDANGRVWIPTPDANGQMLFNLPDPMSMEEFEVFRTDSIYLREMPELQKRMEEMRIQIERFDGDSAMHRFYMFSPDCNGNQMQFVVPPCDSLMMQPQVYTRMLMNEKGRLGVTIQELTPQLARYFELQADEHGILISEVREGTAAERGGLQAGDVIIAIDGANVTSQADVMRGVMEAKETITIEFIRDGDRQQKVIRLDMPEEMPNDSMYDLQLDGDNELSARK
jgi:membrane-associated protease RseP (regulator of RpoE activity)